MEKLLHFEFLSNSIQDYLIVIGVILIALFIKRILSKFIASRLLRMIEGKEQNLKKDNFINHVVPSIERFLLAAICITTLDKLNFPEALHFKIAHVTFEDVVSATAVVIMVVTFIQLCIKVISFIALIIEERHGQTKADSQLIVFLRDFLRAILVIIGCLLIVRFAFNKDIGKILTGLSIVGAALALSAKESLENLIASFIIFFDKPFVAGETVKVLNTTGTVEKIGLRSTRIRTDQKTYITVPNKQMVDTVVDNISLRTQRKVELRLELSLSATVEQLKMLSNDLRKILNSKRDIEKYIVYLMDTGKNAHIVAVDYFTTMDQTADEFNMFREEVNFNVIELLAKSGISLAASSTDVVVRNAKES